MTAKTILYTGVLATVLITVGTLTTFGDAASSGFAGKLARFHRHGPAAPAAVTVAATVNVTVAPARHLSVAVRDILRHSAAHAHAAMSLRS